MPYNFTSVGASAQQALQALMVQREQERRQQLLDGLRTRETEAQIAGGQESRDLARDQFAYGQKRDVEERTYRDEQNRTAAQERLARDEAERGFRGEQAELTRQARAEQEAANRELRETIARLSASNSQASRALADQLKTIQIDAAKDKLETGRADRQKAADSTSSARGDVANLAAELLGDPSLDRRVGPIQGRLPAISGKSKDFDNRALRLKSMLSLESRAKLKGSGAISDFEARTLEQAATALDQATSEVEFRRELERIVKAMGGQGAGPRRYNPQTGRVE